MRSLVDAVGRPDSVGRANITKPKWLNVVSHLDPRYGGLSSAVPALSNAVARAGDSCIHLAGFCQDGENFRPALASDVTVGHYPANRRKWLGRFEQKQRFRQLVAGSNGVHIHGLWEASTTIAARYARACSKPYLISVHGMLEPWALANKRLKKRLYAAFVERNTLNRAACLHALTHNEAQNYRDFGLRNPIVIIPNGVDIPTDVSPSLFLDDFPELRGKRLLLFLGRIHFKKGLDILIRAWSRLANQFPDAQLVVAGPNFENTQGELESLSDKLGLTSRVTFTGMLNEATKWSALAAAHVFVLPSYSEGLSVSVLEAMGIGVPVVISDQCNLPEVAEHSCGWIVAPNVDRLAAALDLTLRTSSSEMAARAANGRLLTASRYSWNAIGAQMTSVYAWLDGSGPQPRGVEFWKAA